MKWQKIYIRKVLVKRKEKRACYFRYFLIFTDSYLVLKNNNVIGSKQSVEEPQDILESIREAVNESKSNATKSMQVSNSNGKR